MKPRGGMDSAGGRRIAYGLASAGVTAAVFGYLFSRVSPGAVFDAMRSADPRYLAAFVALSFAMNVFRTWRYGLALASSGFFPRPAALFLVVLVRNLFSDLLPARIGSLIYVYLLTSRLGVPFGATASSFALAFLFDTMAIAPLIALATVWAGAGTRLPAGALAGAGGLLLVAVGVALHWLPAAVRLAARLVRRLPAAGPARRERWSAAVLAIGCDAARARESGVYARLLALSLGVRVAKYAALYALLLALLRPLGYRAAEIGVPKVFLGICSSELAASLPVSGIAGFGLYEGTWAAVFALLGFPGDVARLTGISHHLITQVYGYALGAAALALLLLPWLRVRSEMSRPPSDGGRPAAFYARLALTTLGLLAGVAASFAAVQSCAGGAGRQGPRAVAPELPAGGAGPRGVAGRVLFDSDRGGTFGLYTMKPDGTDARCLLDGPMAEIYPDPSPDGRWIAFAKATSAGKGAVSEVWICRSDGSGARRLSGDGTFPTFSGDGKTVYFERDRKKVMAVGVDGGGEREIFPAGRPAFARYAVVKPRVSPDGRWVAAISDRGGRWNTWAAELASGRETHVGAGCEPAWFPDSRRVAWVRKQGVRQGSGLFVKDVLTGATEELQDAGPPLGHEYFPTVSRDGRFLLWSACPEGQHGHEGSDYQVFIRDLAGGGAVRLTYDAANNRWPKILPDAAR